MMIGVLTSRTRRLLWSFCAQLEPTSFRSPGRRLPYNCAMEADGGLADLTNNECQNQNQDIKLDQNM